MTGTDVVTRADDEAYERDGVAVLPGVDSQRWTERMQAAVDRVIAAPTAIAGTCGASSHGVFPWSTAEGTPLDHDLFPALAV